MTSRFALKLTRKLLSLISLICIASAAHAADTWPTRPIRLIVPSAAGGGTDILARAMAERLSAALKQQVIVDDRPGASGLIATKAVVRALGDGYTLLYTNASATVMLAALKPDLGFDLTKDLMPVAATAFGGVLLLVNPQVPANNLKELIALVKAHPGTYTYASWAVGSNGHLTMEWLKRQTGMHVDHVPYKTMPSILTDLSTGVVNIGWTDPVSPVPFIQAGKLKAIAVNGSVRTPKLPNLATMGEQGYPFPAIGWQGVFAPVGTPPEVIQRLHTEINRIQATPDLKALMSRLNVEPPPIWTTEQFHALVSHDLEVWKKIVLDANVSAN